MNNVLSFEQYKKELRVMESHLIDQILDGEVNEGISDKIKKFVSTRKVDKILSDEIELGKQLEERIKTTMNEIQNACEKLKTKSTKKSSEFLQSVENIIDEITSMSFDTLTLLGDSDIDFAGFRNSVIFANVVRFAVLISPIKNYLITKKAYNYFIGLIKQTIRKDIVMLQINFDQFQNLILQKALESEESVRNMEELKMEMSKVMGGLSSSLRDVFKNDSKSLKRVKQVLDKESQRMKMERANNPLMGFFMNSYENTYKQTAEVLKQHINDDSQRQLDALKNGITKIATGNEDMGVFGEILISAAEEHALKCTTNIHKKFLMMAEVFKLSNQKKLVELIMDAEKEALDEEKRLQEETEKNEELEKKTKLVDFFEDEGESIFGEKSNWSYKDWKDLTEKIEGPDGIRYTKKSILEKWLSTHPKELSGCEPELKLAIPIVDVETGEIDSHEKNTSYLSYMDILIDDISVGLKTENTTTYSSSGKPSDGKKYKIDLSAEESKTHLDNVVRNFDGKDTLLEIALELISENVVRFNHNTLYSTILKVIKKDSSGDVSGKVIIDKSDYDEFKTAIQKMRQFRAHGSIDETTSKKYESEDD